MTDSQILTVVDRLERCLLSPAEFHHRHHLAVAVAYLYAAEFEAALDKMRSSLCRFVADHDGNRYHETITRFWMLQAKKCLDRNLCLHDSVDRVTLALQDKNLIHQYYSRQLLDSARAKQSWLPPDLCAL